MLNPSMKEFTNLPFNEDMARKHLQLLFINEDITNKKFIFCVFPDNKLKSKSNPNYRRTHTATLYGTFDTHINTLREYNAHGCGIFLAINRFDDTGKRKLTNITSINTVFIEADNDIPKPLPIEPSFRIQSSKGKYHYYFLTHTTDLEEANAVQQRLVNDFGCDPNAKDLSRVLRIAGFSHVKDKQQLVTIDTIKIEVQDAYEQSHNTRHGSVPIAAHYRYDWDEITNAFPPVKKQQRFTEQYVNSQSKITQPDTILIMTILALIDPTFEGNRDGWITIGMILHFEFRGSPEGFEIMNEWSRGDYFDTEANPGVTIPPKSYDQSALQMEWNSFSYNTTTRPVRLGTLVQLAQDKYGYVHDNEPPPCVISMVPRVRDTTLKKMNRRMGIATNAGGKTSIVLRRPSTGLYQFASEKDVALKYSNVRIPVLKNTKEGPKIELKPALPIWKEQAIRYDDVVFYPTLEGRPLPSKVEMPHAQLTDSLNYEDNAELPLDLQMEAAGLDGDMQLNRFSGYDIQPIPGDWSPIEDLILNVICDGNQAAATYFHKWVAHGRQFPRRKTGVMITLTGSKGAGKSVASELVQGIHQPYAMKVSSFDEILNRFNSTLAYSTLLAPEEAVWGGDGKQNSKLKDLITSNSLQVEEKFEGRFDTGSFFDLLATANKGFSAPQEANDQERRFLTLTVSDKHRKDTAYFSQFGRTISNDEQAEQTANDLAKLAKSASSTHSLQPTSVAMQPTSVAMQPTSVAMKVTSSQVQVNAKRKRLLEHYLDYLLSLDLDDWNPQDLPKVYSENATQNVLHGDDGALSFLMNAYENEEILPLDDDMAAYNEQTEIRKDTKAMYLNESDDPMVRVLISVKLLKEAYTQFTRENGYKNNIQSAKNLTSRLALLPNLGITTECQPSVQERQMFTSLKKSYYVQLPTRAQFKQYLIDNQLIKG